ncbi:MAG TPA: hypothetical protein VGE67_13750, partial [Haloferula sp.]
DLANQRKNTYGNSYEAARKGIRRFKRASARRERRVEKSSLGVGLDPDEAGSVLKFPFFRQKWADTPMGEVLARRLARRIWLLVPAGASEEWVAAFHADCIEDGVLPASADAWARYLRGELTCGAIPLPKMDLGELRQLTDRLGRPAVAGSRLS